MFQRFGQFILGNPDWEPTFAPKGQFLKVGEHVSRPAYGRTLKKVAEEGAEVFYQVNISQPIAQDLE